MIWKPSIICALLCLWEQMLLRSIKTPVTSLESTTCSSHISQTQRCCFMFFNVSLSVLSHLCCPLLISHLFKMLDGFKLSAERLILCAARRLHISFCGVQRGQPTSIMFSCFCSGAPRWKYSNAASVGTSVIDRSVCMVVSACVWVFTSSPLRCWSQS